MTQEELNKQTLAAGATTFARMGPTLKPIDTQEQTDVLRARITALETQVAELKKLIEEKKGIKLTPKK